MRTPFMNKQQPHQAAENIQSKQIKPRYLTKSRFKIATDKQNACRSVF